MNSFLTFQTYATNSVSLGDYRLLHSQPSPISATTLAWVLVALASQRPSEHWASSLSRSWMPQLIRGPN
jgi:hypothetical protein